MTTLFDDLDALHRFWFGDLDDRSRLDPRSEPFATHYARWYGKQASVDDAMRAAFEPLLTRLTASPGAWRDATASVAGNPRRTLALTVLIDQVPRNVYRGTPRMYALDALAVDHAVRHVDAAHAAPTLGLVEVLFASVPLMHAEDLALQRRMEGLFQALARRAEVRSPHNRGFFEMASAFARRHREVVERFGRFPHRNAILGRVSTEEEERALATEDIAF